MTMPNMQATSLEAYENNKRTLGITQAKVFNTLFYSLAPMTNDELSLRLGWTINRVTGRTNELVKKGLVKEAHKKKCANGRTAIAWRIKRPDEIHERQMEMGI